MLTKARKAIHEQTENFNTENIKKYQVKVIQLKNSVTEVKNSLEGLSGILDQSE